jgi:transcriptional regulator GlxA family with amidase domain
MAKSDNPKTMRSAIFLMNSCIGSVIHGILDALIAANYTLIKSAQSPLFHWDTVSIDGQPVQSINGLMVQPDYDLESYLEQHQNTDAWIIPSFFNTSSDYQKIVAAIDAASPIIPILQQHYANGGLILSICSGSFLLARAGLMDNRLASMHWQLEPHFRRMFPSININTQQTIADSGNIISATGGAVAHEHLIMYLVERFAGIRVAVDTAKLLMINLKAPSPLPYRTDVETQHHNDKIVHLAQSLIENNSNHDINISELAEQVNISERQLNRRFSKHLNCTPNQYLQRIRIKRACNLLESTQLPSSKIVYEVGYKDESSFRRLFKREMDITMENYRQQFSSVK